jgi:hypothetical protein
MSLTLTGQLLEIEHVPPFERGEFKRPAFPRLHVLDGREVYPVDIDPRTFADALPSVGSRVEIALEPRAFVSRGNATIAYNLVSVRTQDAAKPKAA